MARLRALPLRGRLSCMRRVDLCRATRYSPVGDEKGSERVVHWMGGRSSACRGRQGEREGEERLMGFWDDGGMVDGGIVPVLLLLLSSARWAGMGMDVNGRVRRSRLRRRRLVEGSRTSGRSCCSLLVVSPMITALLSSSHSMIRLLQGRVNGPDERPPCSATACCLLLGGCACGYDPNTYNKSVVLQSLSSLLSSNSQIDSNNITDHDTKYRSRVLQGTSPTPAELFWTWATASYIAASSMPV